VCESVLIMPGGEKEAIYIETKFSLPLPNMRYRNGKYGER